MRLARVEIDGDEDFAYQSSDGHWVPLLSADVRADDIRELISARFDIAEAERSQRGRPLGSEPRLGCPIVRPSKVLAIGLNYRDHIRETGAQVPERPIVFAKYANSLNGPFASVIVEPDLTEQGDYEVELAVVIGRRCRRVTQSNALDYVFGFCVANDVSARDWQQRDAQVSRSKSMDTFCPLGPWITTADDVADPQSLAIKSWVNGETRQDSNTSQMLFGVAELIEFLSRTMTLEPGDVILTGTPHGVGFAMDPPIFLQAGDIVRCEIEGLGAIENPIVAG